MFEIPNAKRVRRDELYGSSSDGDDPEEQGAEDAEERARLNERLSSLLGLDLSASAPAPAPEQGPDAADPREHEGAEDQEGNHDEEFEFRLFSGPAGTSAPAKVVLDASDDEDARKGDGAFVKPSRPQSYYLAEEATPGQRERYWSAAVTAEDIAAGARKRAWGLERPWRVVKISLSSRKPRSRTAGPGDGATTGSEDGEDGPKRKRPGKKRRIAVRIKARTEKERREADKARREAEEKQRLSKEEHLLEKKKRLNREKKLKRRAKEKEKKLAAGEMLPPSEAPDSSGPE
ncbi:hypothetical protein F5883DRAFT_645635 [Diaporthe sp. PMI_573]|nr:hypothetical protein F5883DRAFT_645635 [Diaporthaceae sp. PMI_573]